VPLGQQVAPQTTGWSAGQLPAAGADGAPEPVEPCTEGAVVPSVKFRAAGPLLPPPPELQPHAAQAKSA
jgi:hypothetical protein